jgi:hypothetical protein
VALVVEDADHPALGVETLPEHVGIQVADVAVAKTGKKLHYETQYIQVR